MLLSKYFTSLESTCQFYPKGKTEATPSLPALLNIVPLAR